MTKHLGLAAVLAAATLAACDLPFDIGKDRASIEILSGDEQVGDEGEWLPLPIRVVVRDGRGNGAAQTEVRWRVVAGRGSLYETVTRTDSLGIAVNYWTLGPQAAAQEVSAEVLNAGTATFRARSEFPRSQRVRIVGADLSPDTVGRQHPQPLQVQVLDENGSVAEGVQVRWVAAEGSGFLHPAESRTDADGRTLTVWTLGPFAGGQAAYALVDSLPPAEARVLAHAGAPVTMSAWNSGPSVVGLMATSLVVQTVAHDRYGNRIQEGITWAPDDPTTVIVDEVFGTDAGEAQANLRMRRAGMARMTARAGTLFESVTVEARSFRTAAMNETEICGIENSGVLACWRLMPADTWSWPNIALRDLSPPIRLRPTESFTSVDMGERHACAVAASGVAYCWGDNRNGAVGVGASTPEVTTPTAVRGGLTFSAVSTGYGHSCGVTTERETWCWGLHNVGQLGSGADSGTCYAWSAPRICASEPVRVAGEHDFTAVSTGLYEHTCALDGSGAAWCWGSNGSGQLGTPSTTEICGATGAEYACSRIPIAVSGGHRFETISAGAQHTCALTAAGEAWCWGGGGLLGRGGAEPESYAPVAVVGKHVFTHVRSGSRMTCGRTKEGRVFCWGQDRPTPEELEDVSGSAGIVVGRGYGGSGLCGLGADGTLNCWKL